MIIKTIMENELKFCLMLINQERDKVKELEIVYRHKKHLYHYYMGKRQSYDQAAKLISNILNLNKQ